MTRQLALSVQLPRNPNLADFVPGGNGEALAAVRGAEPYVYLWGDAGTGKSHLLLGACAEADGQRRQAQYLNLGGHADLAPEMLDGLECMDLVCLDNVDAVAGRDAWEHALFVLYNRLRDRGARLLASAHQPPPDLPLRLADLRSRLSWGPVFRLRALSDDARLELLQRSAAARGMELSATAGRYILNHCARDLHSLQALLDRLDDASLAAQRKPSIAMIQRIVDAEAAS